MNDSDLSLSVRQEDIYPTNISFCQDGCFYNGVDLENKRVYCKCNSNLSKEYDENEKTQLFIEEVEENFFIYIIDMINYQIVLCYHLLFDINNYYLNFGFYIGFFIYFIIIILCFYYCCKGKNVIKINYLRNEPNIYEIKKLEKEFNKKYKINNIEYNKNQRLLMKKPKTHIKIKSKLFNQFSNPSKKKTIIINKNKKITKINKKK